MKPELYLKKNPELIETLEKLSKSFRLICLTNNPVNAARKTLAAIGADRILPDIIGLDTCMKSKPSPEMLELASKRTGVPFCECLSVGDRYDIDLALPLKMGMGAVEVTGALLDGAVKTLEKHGALTENIHVKTVPGSFELIYGAHQMVLNGGYDAVIILGSVIRGETPHFDYICEGVTYGIARLNATQEIPVIYGLLTTNDLQQAKDRSGGKLGNKGDECAIDAIKMAKF